MPTGARPMQRARWDQRSRSLSIDIGIDIGAPDFRFGPNVGQDSSLGRNKRSVGRGVSG